MTPSARWNPTRYLAYADERARPFFDLTARIDAPAPGTVLDLGCGPGNLTATLAARWPAATVTGVDSSAEMIERARADHPEHPGLAWVHADLRRHLDDVAPVDVLVSNATLQWVPGHLDLLPALLDAVRSHGWLAFQVPGNFGEPSHVTLHALAAEEPYAAHAADAVRPASHDAVTYLHALRGLGATVDAWETTYLHVLDATADPDPVFTWISGTGARPILQALPEDLRERFVAEFKARLREAYPVRAGRVVLPFRRIFVVARKEQG